MTETELLEAELIRTRQELALARQTAAGAATAQAALAAFVSLPSVSLSVFDREMRILQVSPGWCDRAGVPVEQALGRSVYEVDPSSLSLAPLHQRCLGGDTCGDEDVVFDRHGRPAHLRIEMAPWRSAGGEVGGVVALSQETTDLVRSREAVRRSEQRLGMALELFESVVWEMSYKDRRLFSTGALRAIYDQPPTYRAFAEDMLVSVHPADRARVERLWSAHVADNSRFHTQYRINRQDGAEVWVECVAETLRDPSGVPERVIGVVKNITERRQSDVAVAHAREAAEAANRAKSEFLANMSHEIRTPLNGVMGVAGALAGTPLTADQRQMVRLIESSGQTLERLLTEVLDLARIESGRFEIKAEPFDLTELVRGVCALFEPRAREKGVAFSWRVGPGGDYVGDAVRIRQILTNLLSNAVKFTERGSVGLDLAVEPGDDGASGRLTFEVSDTGIGFEPERAGRLFERFEQADGSITRRYGGSGLGLAISRSLAERMGGTLKARSRPGEGSVFTLDLELPLDHAPARPGGPETDAVPAPPARLRPARVLLAEDHPTNRKVVELILGAAGVDLVSVENGALALEAAKAERFDLILMDMQMPVMDGLAAMRAIRRHESLAEALRTPIIALTANAMAEHATASRLAGADGHVTKPVSAKVLLETVSQAIDQRDARRAAALSA